MVERITKTDTRGRGNIISDIKKTRTPRPRAKQISQSAAIISVPQTHLVHTQRKASNSSDIVRFFFWLYAKALALLGSLRHLPRVPAVISEYPRRFFAALILIGAVIVIALITHRHLSPSLSTDSVAVVPEKLSQTEEQRVLIGAIGKLVLLPNEDPMIIAQVTNVDLLRQSQSFYSKAQNGDIVIVFEKAREAILYRPNINKIITISQVIVPATSSPLVSSSSPTRSPATKQTPPAGSTKR